MISESKSTCGTERLGRTAGEQAGSPRDRAASDRRGPALYDLLEFVDDFDHCLGLGLFAAVIVMMVRCPRPVERLALDDPRTLLEPASPIDHNLFHLAGMRGFVCPVPHLDAVVNPAMKLPENRVNMRAVEVAQIVIFEDVPLPILHRSRHVG